MKISSLILPVVVVLSTPAAAHECRPKAEAERNAADNGIPQLVAVTPEQWRWSSLRVYALGEKGAVAVNAMFPPKGARAA